MIKNFLLPYKFKTVGLWLFFPFLALCLWLLLFGDWDCDLLSWPAFAISIEDITSKEAFTIIRNDPVNEFAMLGLLVSVCFIALAKEKDEDEMTGQIRMQTFVWSFWVTAAILAFGILFFYGFSFLNFALAALFLAFIIYIMKFNLTMCKIRRAGK
ncbi:MAG: hypothetical protein ACI3ZC_08615 [Candidatus Cryptobacteroides sp.]